MSSTGLIGACLLVKPPAYLPGDASEFALRQGRPHTVRRDRFYTYSETLNHISLCRKSCHTSLLHTFSEPMNKTQAFASLTFFITYISYQLPDQCSCHGQGAYLDNRVICLEPGKSFPRTRIHTCTENHIYTSLPLRITFSQTSSHLSCRKTSASFLQTLWILHRHHTHCTDGTKRPFGSISLPAGTVF